MVQTKILIHYVIYSGLLLIDNLRSNYSKGKKCIVLPKQKNKNRAKFSRNYVSNDPPVVLKLIKSFFSFQPKKKYNSYITMK